MYTTPEFPLQQILELACAAQRHNKNYIKSLEVIYTDDMKVAGYRHANRNLIIAALGEDKQTYTDPLMKPDLISTNMDDRALADDIQTHFRKLSFAAIQGDNDFLTEVNSLLNSEKVPLTKLGFIACLPSVFNRDYSETRVKKFSKKVDEGFLADIGTQLIDLDCEVLSCRRSKNFDAYNIDAIIDNKMVSWMSKQELKLGPAVIIKAKVKDHTQHWKHENCITRLNYVEAAQ